MLEILKFKIVYSNWPNHIIKCKFWVASKLVVSQINSIFILAQTKKQIPIAHMLFIKNLFRLIFWPCEFSSFSRFYQFSSWKIVLRVNSLEIVNSIKKNELDNHAMSINSNILVKVKCSCAVRERESST